MFTLQLLPTLGSINCDLYPINTSSISPLVQIIQSATGTTYTLCLLNIYIMSSNTICSDLDKTFKLQISIGQIIDDTLYNWNNSQSKITIESFKKKSHCLVIEQNIITSNALWSINLMNLKIYRNWKIFVNPWRVLRDFKHFHFYFLHPKYEVSYTFIIKWFYQTYYNYTNFLTTVLSSTTYLSLSFSNFNTSMWSTPGNEIAKSAHKFLASRQAINNTNSPPFASFSSKL